MKTYVFGVVVEPDEDCWSAYCPALEGYGAASWGYTREEALKNIHEVVEMVEDEEPIPERLSEEVSVSSGPRVIATI